MRISYLIIVVLTIVGILPSCNSEMDRNNTGEQTVIRLTLGANEATRSHGSITDNGGTVGTGEGKINTVCVGIFDTSQNLLTLHEYTYTGVENIITTTKAKEIIVVANAPAGAFKNTTNKTDFLARTQSLSYTTTANGLADTYKARTNSQQPTAMPMLADTTLASNLSASALNSQSIKLTRKVARVAIASIKTDFGATTPFANATFVPKEIFMYNVNDQSQWNGTVSTSATTLSGETTKGTSLADSTITNTSYLSSGALNWTGHAGSYTYLDASNGTDKPYYFYVFPHNATSPTKLIIKGIFYPKGGSEATGEVMYYPIIINHLQTGTTITDAGGTYNVGDTYTKDSQIASNVDYTLSITIRGRGVTSVSDDLIPTSASVAMSVLGWTSIAYPTNTFTPAKAYPGNYYYDDGSWGTSATPTDGRKAIGVVFSNQTSTADKAKGWTHGYAMALKNAVASSPGVAWSTNTSTSEFSDYSDWASMVADKDGYTKTNTIKTKYSSTLSSNYPAFYKALGYGTSQISGTSQYATPTATNNSNWYLPSIGQWYDICVNLGKMITTPQYIGVGYGFWHNGSTGSAGNAYQCAAAINTYLSTLSSNGYSVDLFSINSEVYLSSSEYQVNIEYYAIFADNGHMHLGSDGITKTDLHGVRSVLAF